MNWKLVLILSSVGVVMGVAALFGLTRGIEPFLWLIIFAGYAVVIAKRIESKHFLHGFMVSVCNGVWIGIIHASFYSTYMANNPEAQEMYKQLPPSLPAPVFMILIGPVIGAVTGLVSGFFAFIAGKFIKPVSTQISQEQNKP